MTLLLIQDLKEDLKIATEDQIETKQDSLSKLRNLTNRLNILAEPTVGSVRK